VKVTVLEFPYNKVPWLSFYNTIHACRPSNGSALSDRRRPRRYRHAGSCRAAQAACSTASDHERCPPEALQKARFPWQGVEVI
jgi:hypothetical protein